jgi:hypothetical protein
MICRACHQPFTPTAGQNHYCRRVACVRARRRERQRQADKNRDQRLFPVKITRLLDEVHHPLDRLALAVVALAVVDGDTEYLQTTGREVVAVIAPEIDRRMLCGS